MAFITTTDKWTAVHALINTWLRDTQIYCGNCDTNYNKNFFPCCNNPVLASNAGHTKAIIEAIKDRKKDLYNEFGSNRKKNFRSTLMLPKRLLHILEKYFKEKNSKLFENQTEMNQFMRKFRMFAIPNRI